MTDTTKKLLIAESHLRAELWARGNGRDIRDFIVVTPYQPEKIMGLELTQNGYHVVDDTAMPYSFWTQLLARVRGR